MLKEVVLGFAAMIVLFVLLLSYPWVLATASFIILMFVMAYAVGYLILEILAGRC